MVGSSLCLFCFLRPVSAIVVLVSCACGLGFDMRLGRHLVKVPISGTPNKAAAHHGAFGCPPAFASHALFGFTNCRQSWTYGSCGQSNAGVRWQTKVQTGG